MSDTSKNLTSNWEIYYATKDTDCKLDIDNYKTQKNISECFRCSEK